MATGVEAQRALLQREADAHSALIEQRAYFQAREAQLSAEAAAALASAGTQAQARDEIRRAQEAASAEVRSAVEAHRERADQEVRMRISAAAEARHFRLIAEENQQTINDQHGLFASLQSTLAEGLEQQ